MRCELADERSPVALAELSDVIERYRFYCFDRQRRVPKRCDDSAVPAERPNIDLDWGSRAGAASAHRHFRKECEITRRCYLRFWKGQ